MAKTIQVSTSPIGDKHACVVALRSDGSLWTFTFQHAYPAGGGEWIRLPAIPDEDGADDPMPMA